MSTRSSLAKLAKLVGEMADDEAAAPQIFDAIAPVLEGPGGVEAIVEDLLAEGRRKQPREIIVHGYVTMLSMALDGLRLAANGADAAARDAIPAIRDMIADDIARGGLPAELLMGIARAFAQAQIDPGPALQQATVATLESEAPTLADIEATPHALSAQFAALAAMLGDDPFAVHQMIAEGGAAFPLDQRAGMVGLLAMSDAPVMREAVLGFAFAPEREISDAAFSAVTARGSGAPVSSVLIERLVRMRPWFSPRRQAAIDNALRTLRPQAQAPQGQPRPEIRSVLTSLCDGAGAESLIVVVKRGRRFAIASVLLKLEVGVADTVVSRDLGQAECEEMAAVAREETSAVEVAIGTLERRVAAALALNVARDVPPPFGLLDVVEAVGIGPLHPEAIVPDALVAELLAELPASKTDESATRAAYRALPSWRKTFAVIESWSETGDAVDALVRPLKKRLPRVDAVLHSLLPGRRNAWAERCAWAAAALKDAHQSDSEAWIAFALVARALASETPLTEIPLARMIAENTVARWMNP